MPRELRYSKVEHNGVTYYQCKECNQEAFKDSRAANLHWNRNHNPNYQEPKCQWCNTTFSRRDALKRHKCDGKSYSSKPIAIPVPPHLPEGDQEPPRQHEVINVPQLIVAPVLENANAEQPQPLGNQDMINDMELINDQNAQPQIQQDIDIQHQINNDQPQGNGHNPIEEIEEPAQFQHFDQVNEYDEHTDEMADQQEDNTIIPAIPEHINISEDESDQHIDLIDLQGNTTELQDDNPVSLIPNGNNIDEDAQSNNETIISERSNDNQPLSSDNYENTITNSVAHTVIDSNIMEVNESINLLMQELEENLNDMDNTEVVQSTVGIRQSTDQSTDQTEEEEQRIPERKSTCHHAFDHSSDEEEDEHIPPTPVIHDEQEEEVEDANMTILQRIANYKVLTKSKKQISMQQLIRDSKQFHNNYESTLSDFVTIEINQMTFQEHDSHLNEVDRVIATSKAICEHKVQGINSVNWMKEFPLFRRLIQHSFDMISIRSVRSLEDYNNNVIPKDKRYQETNQITSLMGRFIMIMMILLKTNKVGNIKQWFIFDVAYENLYLSFYSKVRAGTTVARQREQISWIWKFTFKLIGSNQIFMTMSNDQLGFLTRLKDRLESSKLTLNILYPRKMSFNSECFPQLLEKGTMITQDEEIGILMWLLNNFTLILDVWSKIDNGEIVNFPKPAPQDTYCTYIEKVNPTERNLYKQLIKDTQVIIGSILMIFLYGQRTQISNSITTNTLYNIPGIGLILKPIYEKVTRRSTGISLNNQLESILNWQINYMRRKCTRSDSVKALFIRKDGKPYTAPYWSKLTKDCIRWYNPDITVTGSSTFRRALFSFNDFNSDEIRDVVVKLYNVKNSTGVMYYRTTDMWEEMRKLHEGDTHSYIENNPDVSNQITAVNKVIETSFPSISKNTNTNLETETELRKRLFIAFSFSEAKFTATFNGKSIDVEPKQLLMYQIKYGFLERRNPPTLKEQSIVTPSNSLIDAYSSSEEEDSPNEIQQPATDNLPVHIELSPTTPACEVIELIHSSDSSEEEASDCEEQPIAQGNSDESNVSSPACPPSKLRKLNYLFNKPAPISPTPLVSVFTPIGPFPRTVPVRLPTPSPLGTVIRYPHTTSSLLPHSRPPTRQPPTGTTSALPGIVANRRQSDPPMSRRTLNPSNPSPDKPTDN